MLLALVLLAGCGQQGASSALPETPAEPPVDEVAAHRGSVCPKKLPQASAQSHGFGTGEPAESAPSLPPPEAAWVCEYQPHDAGPGPDGDGTTFEWIRNGSPHQVAKNDLSALAEQLSELVPVVGEQLCAADLGPRWMLVYTTGTDPTGVVIDGFGCQDVRLTDEPFRTVPGEAIEGGTVPGVLTDPTGEFARLAADAAPEPSASTPAP